MMEKLNKRVKKIEKENEEMRRREGIETERSYYEGRKSKKLRKSKKSKKSRKSKK